MLLLILVLLLIFGFPGWGYSRGWGYGPFGIILVIFLALVVFGVLGHTAVWAFHW